MHDASRGRFSLLLPDPVPKSDFCEHQIKQMRAKDPIVPFGIPVKNANDLKARQPMDEEPQVGLEGLPNAKEWEQPGLAEDLAGGKAPAMSAAPTTNVK